MIRKTKWNTKILSSVLNANLFALGKCLLRLEGKKTMSLQSYQLLKMGSLTHRETSNEYFLRDKDLDLNLVASRWSR